MAGDVLRIEVDDRIAVLTLNRPRSETPSASNSCAPSSGSGRLEADDASMRSS